MTDFSFLDQAIGRISWGRVDNLKDTQNFEAAFESGPILAASDFPALEDYLRQKFGATPSSPEQVEQSVARVMDIARQFNRS